MKSRFLFSLVVLATMVPASHAGTLLTFDDLPNFAIIPNGYGGLDWSNFLALDGTQVNPSGYNNGIVTRPMVAFNGSGDPASISSATPFDLTSGYFTGAWSDGLIIVAIGYLGSVQVDAKTFVVDSTAPTLETFNFIGVDKVVFSSSGGVNHGYTTGGPGNQFVLDNLLINGTAVPEPSSIVMSGIGLMVGLGAYARRRKAA